MDEFTRKVATAHLVLFHNHKADGFARSRTTTGLSFVYFFHVLEDGREHQLRLIEQNPTTGSRWADLAIKGHHVAWVFDEQGYVKRHSQSIVSWEKDGYVYVTNPVACDP